MKPVKQEKLMFRVSNNKEGRNILHHLKTSLNSDSYFMRTKYTGPRPHGTPQGSTLKENAESIRVYVDSKREEDNFNRYDYIQRGRDIEKGQQALANVRLENQVKEQDSQEQVWLNSVIQRQKNEIDILKVKVRLLTKGLQLTNDLTVVLQNLNNIDLEDTVLDTINKAYRND